MGESIAGFQDCSHCWTKWSTSRSPEQAIRARTSSTHRTTNTRRLVDDAAVGEKHGTPDAAGDLAAQRYAQHREERELRGIEEVLVVPQASRKRGRAPKMKKNTHGPPRKTGQRGRKGYPFMRFDYRAARNRPERVMLFPPGKGGGRDRGGGAVGDERILLQLRQDGVRAGPVTRRGASSASRATRVPTWWT